ncbi:CbtB domain-containing protein [Methylomonas montana]|uniref:CbtB domain-containing protein n=1 Tax=Methylomonas montana TaxID=3058963 RepID=UPI00265870B6|nr:CbtB domain-containing protein [Methylomonas montana]WKJ91963.1 CbtB domain-containing protein [Methylomonas montana]
MFIQSTRSTLAGMLDTHVIAAVSMMILGVILVLTIGFAPIAEVHNATHDTRHSTGFPCH